MKNKTAILILVSSGLVALLFPYSILNGIKFLSFEINIDAYKDFASFVGGILGTTLSAIAVILIYQTYRLQDQELNATKQLIKEQKFEQNFFQLLNSQKSILNSLNYFDRMSNDDKVGIEFFKLIMKNMDNDYQFLVRKFIPNRSNYIPGHNDYVDQFQEFKIESELQTAQVSYVISFENHHNLLGHYFRHLFHIFKFVDSNLKKEKSTPEAFARYKSYLDILQAQLSSAELAVLFYNGLVFEKMKAYLHKFSFLENLATDDLLIEEHKELYSDCIINEIQYTRIKMKSRKSFRNAINKVQH